MPLKDQIFTQAICVISHHKAQVVAALACRHSLFHSSTIPQLLSDKESTQLVLEPANHQRFYALCVLSDTFQFAQQMIVPDQLDPKWFVNSVLNPLLETKPYFAVSLQSCEISNKNTESLLPELAKVRSLRRLVFQSEIPLRPLLYMMLASVQRLETLELQICFAYSSEDFENLPASFGNATTNLKHLVLRNLKIDPLPFVRMFPKNLISLDLLSCSLRLGLSLQDLVQSFPVLKKLIIARFQISGDAMNAIGEFTELEDLELHHVSITTLGFLQNSRHRLKRLVMNGVLNCPASEFRLLGDLERLEVLHFRASGLDDEIIEQAGRLTSLRELNLSYANNTWGGLNHLKSLVCLKTLSLTECENIGGPRHQSPSHLQELFSSWKSLKELFMIHCNLRDSDLEGIDALSGTLEILDISRNSAITDEGSRHLQCLERLKVLILTNAMISDEGMRTLFAKNPESFPQLEKLELLHCPRITETTFTSYLTQNNNLRRSLRTLYCGVNLSLECVASSIAQFTRLENFDATLLGDTAKTNLILRLMKNLKTLYYVPVSHFATS